MAFGIVMDQRLDEHDLTWTTEPMRWGQINIREIEPPEFDVAWWENYFRQVYLHGITLNAGGTWAYYPTKLPDMHHSKWLGGRDLFGELVQAAKRCNMRVLARIDPSLSHEDVYWRHPDWFAADADGRPMRELLLPELYVACLTGPYYWEFVPQIMREIHSRYDVDGIFTSEWDGRRRICYCSRCQEQFREFSSLSLPVTPDPKDLAWKQWMVWQTDLIDRLAKFWSELNKSVKPGVIWMGNHSDKGFVADYVEMINVDNQSRREHDPLWLVGEQGKKMRAITRGKKPYFHIFSSNSYSRHVSKPEAEYRLYIADALLADSRPWFTIIGGVQADRRQFGPLADMYRWHHKYEDYLRDRRSLAEVAIAFYDRDKFIPAEQRGGEAFRGMYYCLLRSRIPFDLVHVARMDEEATAPYKLLILPNIGCLSEREAADVRHFAGRGGSVLATYETGVYDELGNRRLGGVLDDLLGVARRRTSLGPLNHAYAALHGSHPVLTGLQETGITLQNGAALCPVLPAAGTVAPPLTLIPPYPSYPPEAAFSRTGDSALPLCVLTEGQAGQGRRVYWPSNVDAFLYATNSPDWVQLLRNSVHWAFPGRQPVEVVGPGLIEIHPYRQATNIQVHIVNFTNPDTWNAPVHELVPVGMQIIRVRVPEGQAVQPEARCLVAERMLPVTLSSGWAEVQVPEILDHEIVTFNLRAEAREA